MKLNNVNNRISINKLIDCNFINSRLGSSDIKIKGKKKILKIINSLLLFAPLTSNGIITENQYTGALNAKQIFRLINNKEYENCKKDKNEVHSIESHLKRISTTLESMYGGNRQLIGIFQKEDTNYYYIKNFKNQGYHKLGYVNIDLGLMNISLNLLDKYQIHTADYITASIINEMCSGDVIFNYKQMETFFGITKSRLLKAFNNLQVITINSRRRMTYGESKNIEIKGNITDGVQIYGGNFEVCQDVLRQAGISFNYDRLLDLREMIISNQQFIKKELFSYNNTKELTKEDYYNIIENDNSNERSIWNRVDENMNLNNAKKVKKQNIHSNGTKNWTEAIENAESESPVINGTTEEDNGIDFAEFCEAVRSDFLEYVTKEESLDTWREYKKELLEYVNKDHPEIKNIKNKIISGINAVQTNFDLMTSPIFCKNWFSNSEIDTITLKIMYVSWNRSLQKNKIDKNVLANALNSLEEKYKADIEKYTEEKFIRELTLLLEQQPSKDDLETAQWLMKELDGLKKINDLYDNNSYSPQECFQMCLDDSQSIDEWNMNLKKKLIKTNNSDLKSWIRTFIKEIENNDFKFIKSLILTCKKNHLVTILEDSMINSDKSVCKDDIKSEIIEKLSNFGYEIRNSNTLANNIRKMILSVKLGNCTVDEAIKEYVSN